MIIYYAHPMSWYHTEAEAADVAALKEFGDVVNPSGKEWDAKVANALAGDYPVMQVFADYIRTTADVVAFRPFYDGKLGAGVAREVFEALIWDKPAWELFGRHDRKSGVQIDQQTHTIGRSQFDIVPLELGKTTILTVAQTKDRIKRKVL